MNNSHACLFLISELFTEMSEETEIIVGVVCGLLVGLIVFHIRTHMSLNRAIVSQGRFIDAAQQLIPSKEVNAIIDEVQRQAVEIEKREDAGLLSKKVKIKRAYDQNPPE